MIDNRLQPSNEPLISSSYTTAEQAKPLFTLTAKEVEMEEQIIGAALLKYHELYTANKQTSTANDWKEAIDYCHKQLIRIKAFQDEQANNNHS